MPGRRPKLSSSSGTNRQHPFIGCQIDRADTDYAIDANARIRELHKSELRSRDDHVREACAREQTYSYTRLQT